MRFGHLFDLDSIKMCVNLKDKFIIIIYKVILVFDYSICLIAYEDAPIFVIFSPLTKL